jgi:hypothetical protein
MGRVLAMTSLNQAARERVQKLCISERPSKRFTRSKKHMITKVSKVRKMWVAMPEAPKFVRVPSAGDGEFK